ncbi:signal peptide peptidase SppA [Halalkalibacter krulwichiae]|uniref:Putative signal peptide peptidase SppA n=1 Tax=Halalkalibacter krulwichiae TaxID=199441 RepID=A0A1X9ME47_9BACI|nr:signal peptide peptidase SppA [Halalkalibacter krulwichiae]ARK31727.1 Putative signal peptide peptidase SppA [Halalkalibacter krulwichiae]
MSRKRWLALIAVAMIFFISLGVNVMTSGVMSNANALLDTSGHEWTEQVIEAGEELGGSIVVLELSGVIQDVGDGGLFQAVGYRHQMFLSQIEHAAKDPSVEGIIIRVNTPGGGVVESAEIHEKIVQAQVEYDKPIYVSMGNMAASGGYYIAAPADKIVASPQTITGSIGVIMESINVAELAENYGVKVNTIKSGPYKDIMSAMREMTDEDRDILQSIIDESYDEFVRIIAEGRNMTENEVRAIADGRIYTGNQAFELNLVDDLGSLDDTISMMRDLVGEYNVIKYEPHVGFPQFLSMSMQKLTQGDHELATLERILSTDRSPTLKYIYTD